MSWSKEAEQCVIGGCFLDDFGYEVVSDTGMKADDFYHAGHKVAFKAIETLTKRGCPIDVVTVSEYLENSNQIQEAGGSNYLSSLMDMVPSTENLRAYAEIIYDYSRKRQLKAMSVAADDLLNDGESVEAVQDYISSELMRISEGVAKKSIISAGAALKTLIERIQSRADGVSADMAYRTGLDEVDNLVRLEGGRLYVIAGRPGMGKSTFAQKISDVNASDGISVLNFSMEMPAEEVIARSVSAKGNVSRDFMQDPNNKKYTEEWNKLAAASSIVKDWPLFIDDSSSLRVSDIKNKTRSFLRKSESYQKDGRAVLIIDYLGLMKLDSDNRVQGLGEVTKELKRLAMELKIPVILLHQLNRGVDSREDKRPKLSDLRDSGEIEEDADAVLFLYRDEVYNEDSSDSGIAEVIARKNRTGQPGIARVAATLKFSRFDNLSSGY